jgi:predicted nucleic acid-binding protein
MKYLIDTNIISELRKSNCNPYVKTFMNGIPQEDLYLSVISIGEIAFGLNKLPNGKKRTELFLWLYTQLPEWFNGRILPIDYDVMIEWGRICAKHKKTLPIIDSLLTATALTHHLILITRNTKDFEEIEDLSVINPWLS